MNLKTISIIIPTYNGKHLLEKNLPSVYREIKKIKLIEQIIIIDNGSADGTIDFIKKYYPNINLIIFKKNLGYARAVNYAIKIARGDLVFLLNNDVKLEEIFFEPLLSSFYEIENLFSIIPKSITNYKETKNVNESICAGEFSSGLFKIKQKGLSDINFEIKNRVTNLHSAGGFGIYNRKKMLQLNCFDLIYEPFYWEDVDICYRAWKRNWISIYEPNAKVYHQSHQTVNRLYSEEEVYEIYKRNCFLFIWKNIFDKEFLNQHYIYLKEVIKKQNNDTIILLQALKKIYNVLENRKKETQIRNIITDKEILELSANREI